MREGRETDYWRGEERQTKGEKRQTDEGRREDKRMKRGN
jgi:hypothetical protein